MARRQRAVSCDDDVLTLQDKVETLELQLKTEQEHNALLTEKLKKANEKHRTAQAAAQISAEQTLLINAVVKQQRELLRADLAEGTELASGGSYPITTWPRIDLTRLTRGTTGLYPPIGYPGRVVPRVILVPGLNGIEPVTIENDADELVARELVANALKRAWNSFKKTTDSANTTVASTSGGADALPGHFEKFGTRTLPVLDPNTYMDMIIARQLVVENVEPKIVPQPKSPSIEDEDEMDIEDADTPAVAPEEFN